MLLGSRFLGKIEVWDDAEAKLTGALNHLKATTGQEWHLNPGDGAFYGPKIDIKVRRPSAGWLVYSVPWLVVARPIWSPSRGVFALRCAAAMAV